MKPKAHHALAALVPDRPEDARPCRVPSMRPQPDAATIDAQLISTRRELAQTQQSLEQLLGQKARAQSPIHNS